MNNEDQTTLSTQGDTNEQQDQLRGTTNLSLDQLKEAGGIAGASEDNPDRLENPDDLHEVQAGDDLDEPDPDDYQAESENEDDVIADDDETGDEDQSANDVDGNGGYPDDAETLSNNS
jgi:hypothetical protein